MPAGIKYNLTPDAVERELYDQKTGYRLSGGFNLVIASLVAGGLLPPLAPLAIDFATRKATPVVNVKAYANISAKKLKIEKGSLVKTGMHLGTGAAGATIASIDATGADYDELTLSATIEGVAKGDVLFEAAAVEGTEVKNVANALNFTFCKVETGATVTALGRAYEIKTDKLYVPVSAKDKVSLGARFMFI